MFFKFDFKNTAFVEIRCMGGCEVLPVGRLSWGVRQGGRRSGAKVGKGRTLPCEGALARENEGAVDEIFTLLWLGCPWAD